MPVQYYLDFTNAVLSGGATLQSDGSGHIASQYVNFPYSDGLGSASTGVCILTLPEPMSIGEGAGLKTRFRARALGNYPGFPTLIPTVEAIFKLGATVKKTVNWTAGSSGTWQYNATPSPFNWFTYTMGEFDTIEIRVLNMYTSFALDIFNFLGLSSDPEDFAVSVPDTATVGDIVNFEVTSGTINTLYWYAGSTPYPEQFYVGGSDPQTYGPLDTVGTVLVSAVATLIGAAIGGGSVTYDVESLDNVMVVGPGGGGEGVTDFVWTQPSSASTNPIYVRGWSVYEYVLGFQLAEIDIPADTYVTLNSTNIPYVSGDTLRLALTVYDTNTIENKTIAVYVKGVLQEELILTPPDLEAIIVANTFIYNCKPTWTVGEKNVQVDLKVKDLVNGDGMWLESVVVGPGTFLGTPGLTVKPLAVIYG